MCKTIKQKVRFQAPPATIYAMLVEADQHRALTGKPAAIDKAVGGRFSVYGGAIAGVNVDLKPGKRIVQAWRERSFPEGIFSMATFNLALTENGGTELVLTHRGVPKELIPRISAEWRELYWDKIKAAISSKKMSRKESPK